MSNMRDRCDESISKLKFDGCNSTDTVNEVRQLFKELLDENTLTPEEESEIRAQRETKRISFM